MLAAITILCSCGDDEEGSYEIIEPDYNTEKVYTTNIYGLVVDAETSEPIRGATVQIYRSHYNTTDIRDTDELMLSAVTYDDGRFTLRNIEYENYYYAYKLKLTHSNYDNKIYKLSLKQSETNVDISMNPSKAVAPEIQTIEATNIGLTEATVVGKISYAGDPAYKELGFVISNRNQRPTVLDPAEKTMKYIVEDKKSGEFSSHITGLTQETTYYLRAYVTTENETFYGDVVQFMTDTDKDYYTIGNLMVAREDVSFGATFEDAQSACANCRIGGFSDWRLPTQAELKTLMCEYSSTLHFGINVYYWSKTIYRYDYYYVYFIDQSHNVDWTDLNDDKEARVRPVRTIK